MFKRTWNNYPEKTGPQVEFCEDDKKWIPVQQVFTTEDKRFLASINWSSDKVMVRL